MRVVHFPSLSQFREVHALFSPPTKSQRILGLEGNVEDLCVSTEDLGGIHSLPGVITSSLARTRGESAQAGLPAVIAGLAN